MANTPISGFASGAPAQAGDEFVIARSGANFKLTNTNISSFVLAGPTTQLGAADVASGAVAQTLQVQSNTGAATTGPNFTIKGSSGTTAGGSIIFQTHNGTAYANALTINSSGQITVNSSASGAQGIAKFFAASGTFVGVDIGVNATNYGSLVWNSSTGLAFSTYSNSTPIEFDGSLSIFAPGGTERGRFTSSGLQLGASGAQAILTGDAANTLALKNSTNPQIFRVYSTTTGPSYGYFASGVTDAGVAAADTLFIGTGGAGAAMTKLALVVNGTTRLDYGIVASTWTFSGPIVSSASINTGGTSTANVGNLNVQQSSGYIGWVSRSLMRSSADGRITLLNNTETDFTALLFGGTTSSFPAIKKATTSVSLQVRLADDSGDAAFQCGTATSGGTAFNVNGTGGNSIASVTNTTTGTLLQVLNSTSNPLMTVTDTTSGTLFSVQSTTAATLFSVNDTTSGTLLAVTNSSATDVFTVADTGAITGYDGSTANTIAIRNGTTAQRFRVYNTASGTNNADWEALELAWGANIGYLQTNKNGAGTQRKLYINGVGIRLDPTPAGGGTIEITASNISTDTTTGSKIGTATSQKIGFWNATPIVQPTTAVAEAAFVENSGGTAVNVDSTFGGYTLQQVVQALQNTGLLA